jgi:serine/threonine-protein kinase
MPLADAGCLRDRLRNRPDWPVPRVATRLIRQVAAGLQHLHDHAIVHHDVKPSNILLLRSDDVWLADCGSSRVRGTPAYMSPEQCESRDVAPESDQYGLAVLSYLLLTGRLPFTGSTEQLLHQHVVAPPPPPREVCPSLPAAVERVLLNGLAKTPAARYPTVTAFAFALEQAVGAARWQLADGIAPPDDRTLEAATLEARPSPLSASDSGSGSASALASPPPSRPA